MSCAPVRRENRAAMNLPYAPVDERGTGAHPTAVGLRGNGWGGGRMDRGEVTEHSERSKKAHLGAAKKAQRKINPSELFSYRTAKGGQCRPHEKYQPPSPPRGGCNRLGGCTGEGEGQHLGGGDNMTVYHGVEWADKKEGGAKS